MKKVESDNESVESGSCTCSDYDPDCSWFYDSRILQTSFMRFSILGEDKKTNYIRKKFSIIKNDLKNVKKESNNKEKKTRDIKLDSNSNSNSKRKNVIKITRNTQYKKNDVIKDDHIDKTKINLNQTRFVRNRRKNDSADYIIDNNNEDKSNDNESNDNNINKTYVPKNSFMDNYNNSDYFQDLEQNFDKNDFFPRNMNEYEHNFSVPIEKLYMDNNFMSNWLKSPSMGIGDKTFGIFNNRYNNDFKSEQKERIQKKISAEPPKGFSSSKKNFYNSFSNINYMNDDYNDNNDYNDEKFIRNISNSNIKSNNRNRNLPSRGRTIKEKIVKETKNITLEPGQKIKPKIVTKRKLKPVTNIVNNEDGSHSIITENTTLTTITINEYIDSSKLYHDKYPLDVQLVRQHITKIYKTEIENNPYYPK